MPLDVGALSSLAQVNNWDAIRAGKAQEMQYAVALDNQQKQKLQEQTSALGNIQDALATAKQLGGHVQSPDMERIRSWNNDSKEVETIRKGLREHYGDANAWLAAGGDLELNRYKNALLSSDPVVTGFKNMDTYQQYLADKKLGHTFIDGPYMAGDEKKDGNFEQQLQDYQSGKVKDLRYYGSYKAPDISGMDEKFSKMDAPEPLDPYKKNPVSIPHIQQELVAKGVGAGLSGIALQDFVSKGTDVFRQAQNGATPLTYKQKDPEKLVRLNMALENQRMKEQKFQEAGAGGNLYNALYGDNLLPKDATTASVPIIPSKVKDNVGMSLYGLKPVKEDKKKGTPSGWVGNLTNGDKAISQTGDEQVPVDLNSTSFVVKDITGTRLVKTPTGIQKYTNMTLWYPNKSDLASTGTFYHSHILPDRAAGKFQNDVDGDNHLLKVSVPVTDNPIAIQQLHSNAKAIEAAKTLNTYANDENYVTDDDASE